MQAAVGLFLENMSPFDSIRKFLLSTIRFLLSTADMKPRVRLADAGLADGTVMTLYEHDGAYSINVAGQELMVSRASASEELLGKLGVAALKGNAPARILIGGLGLGFTLRSVLESTGSKVLVDVVELIPAVVEWNRTHLKELNGALLDDPRVKVRQEDVVHAIRGAEPETFDAILLDVDNGPVAMVARSNRSLYSGSGVRAIRDVLKQGGRAVFWSAGPDRVFEARLSKFGFKVEAVPAKLHGNAKKFTYTLYVADKV